MPAKKKPVSAKKEAARQLRKMKPGVVGQAIISEAYSSMMAWHTSWTHIDIVLLGTLYVPRWVTRDGLTSVHVTNGGSGWMLG